MIARSLDGRWGEGAERRSEARLRDKCPAHSGRRTQDSRNRGARVRLPTCEGEDHRRGPRHPVREGQHATRHLANHALQAATLHQLPLAGLLGGGAVLLGATAGFLTQRNRRRCAVMNACRLRGHPKKQPRHRERPDGALATQVFGDPVNDAEGFPIPVRSVKSTMGSEMPGGRAHRYWGSDR